MVRYFLEDSKPDDEDLRVQLRAVVYGPRPGWLRRLFGAQRQVEKSFPVIAIGSERDWWRWPTFVKIRDPALVLALEEIWRRHEAKGERVRKQAKGEEGNP